MCAIGACVARGLCARGGCGAGRVWGLRVERAIGSWVHRRAGGCPAEFGGEPLP